MNFVSLITSNNHTFTSIDNAISNSVKINAFRKAGNVFFIISLSTGCCFFSRNFANFITSGRITRKMNSKPASKRILAVNTSVHVGVFTVGINHLIESHKFFTFSIPLYRDVSHMSPFIALTSANYMHYPFAICASIIT